MLFGTRTVRLLPAFFTGALLVMAAGPGPKADLSLKSIEGQRVRLSDSRGKVVVLNFWATWCAPCAAEIPMLVRAEEDYKPKGVIFIAASVDDRKSKKNVPDFVNMFHIAFSVWLDATMSDLLRLRMGPAVPATAFLDQEGHIILRVQGPMREEELRERLEWLLGDRTRPAPQRMVTH
jgi:thiol-disulfide isomerase/thioredoxin